MRTIRKILSTLIATILVITSFAVCVSADSTVVASGKADYYDWSITSDGVMYFSNLQKRYESYGSNYYVLIPEEAKEHLSQVTSWSIDVTNVTEEDYFFDGCVLEVDLFALEDTVSSLVFTGSNSHNLIVDIFGFNNLSANGIQFSDGITVSRLSINNSGITSLDNTLGSMQGSFALYKCKNLDRINIPSSITNSAISYAQDLKSAAIASSSTRFQFADCDSLSDVTLPHGLTTLEYRSFESCKSLKTLRLPSTVNTIKDYAINDCGLESIYIPKSITKVDEKSLKGCNSLKDVYYAGSPEDWNKITVTYKDNAVSINQVFNNATIHYASEQSGWVKNGDSWNYFDSNGNKVTGWKNLGGTWYYFGTDGLMRTDWQKIDGVWYYLSTDGKMVTGWKKINNYWYYFESSGAMATGWKKDGSVWYYLKSSGAMSTGWEKVGNVWYYFNASGAMQTGWIQDGKTWYYMDSSGAMITGWRQLGDSWYFFESSGNMITGWKQIGGVWYFFDDNGHMLTGSHSLGGVTYTFDSNGHCTNPYG